MTPDDKKRVEAIRKCWKTNTADENFLVAQLDEAHEVFRLLANEPEASMKIRWMARKVLGEE